MNISLCKRYFVFYPIILVFSVILVLFLSVKTAYGEGDEMILEASTTPAITDEEINRFLFRISDDVRENVLALAGASIEALSVPILFSVSPGDFTDTWMEARAGGRVHTGTDIIAPRGELVISPTDAVVTKIGYDDRGGNFVVTANPGGEQFYYAHLDRVAEDLSVGDILKKGGLIGYVGNTGNARGKSPHLHFEIYYKGLSQNPFPRLVQEFSSEERGFISEEILSANEIKLSANNSGVRFLQRFLIQRNTGSESQALARAGATGYFGPLTKNALAEYQAAVHISPSSGYFGPVTKAHIVAAVNPDGTPPKNVAHVFEEVIPEAEVLYSLVTQINANLEIGSSGDEVVWLQEFLVGADTGPHAKTLASAGATGYFGKLTKNALAEYQEVIGIDPASGYFGPITRTSIKTLGGN